MIVGVPKEIKDHETRVGLVPSGVVALREAGHEVANHSFSHEPWLHLYSREQLEHEFDRAEASIEHATGKRPGLAE